MQREKELKRPSPSTDDESGTDNSNSADKFEWVGEPLKSSVHRDFYKAVRILETGDVVKMRDNVMVEAGDDNEPYVAKCLAMWEDKRTGVRWMRTQWYYRAGDVPEEVLNTVKNYPHIIGKGGLRKRELFESHSHDDNDLRAMIASATVVHDQTEFARLQKNVAGATTFLCRFSYDPREQRLKPLDVLEASAEQTSGDEAPTPSGSTKTPGKGTTTQNASPSSATPESAPKSNRTGAAAAKSKAATAAVNKTAKPKAKPAAKARTNVKRPRNNATTKPGTLLRVLDLLLLYFCSPFVVALAPFVQQQASCTPATLVRAMCFHKTWIPPRRLKKNRPIPLITTQQMGSDH